VRKSDNLCTMYFFDRASLRSVKFAELPRRFEIDQPSPGGRIFGVPPDLPRILTAKTQVEVGDLHFSGCTIVISVNAISLATVSNWILI
jgi:hypothetical protein